MEKEKIHVGQENVTNDIPKQTKGKKTKKHKNLNSWLFDSYNPKLMKISRWLGNVLFIAAVTIFVTLGCVMHNWSKTWMIFIFVPVIPSILTCIAKRKVNSFAIAFLITGIYCAIGMNIGMWHPTWTMFFGIILYHSIATAIDKKILVKNLKEAVESANI